jgi:hypothetical protein
MSFNEIFARATARILAHATGDAPLLRGEIVDPPRDIAIEHGVEFGDEYGRTIAVRSIATINVADAPASRDTLLVDGDSYVLDTKVTDDGFAQRWTLVKTS